MVVKCRFTSEEFFALLFVMSLFYKMMQSQVWFANFDEFICDECPFAIDHYQTGKFI